MNKLLGQVMHLKGPWFPCGAGFNGRAGGSKTGGCGGYGGHGAEAEEDGVASGAFGV